jgi:hypothetical protein
VLQGMKNWLKNISFFFKRKIYRKGCLKANFIGINTYSVMAMTLNKYFPFAILYFFLNSLGLPFGLTYTALLAPFFYWWVLNTRKKEILFPFFILLFPFVFIHFVFIGVDDNAYITSLLNLAAVYIFCQAFYTFLKKCEEPEKILKRIVVINFILCVIAIPFYFTSWSDFFWIKQPLTEGIDDFKRLRLFTYEASYYATLMVPLFFFFFLKIVFNQNRTNAWLVFLLITVPYVLSFSIGVISAILLSAIVVFIFYFGKLMRKKRVINLIAISVMIVIPAMIAMALLFPGNILFSRLQNIVTGHDSSGRGRTYEALYLAMKIMALKSNFFGIGLGQIKVIGTEIIRDFYLYPADYRIAIPNVTAETLALFGWVGLSIRFLAEIFLFFYTQVWKNYYRVLLFIFIFIYQFTGSFITNIAEYVIWILAFTEVFPQFRVNQTITKNVL